MRTSEKKYILFLKVGRKNLKLYIRKLAMLLVISFIFSLSPIFAGTSVNTGIITDTGIPINTDTGTGIITDTSTGISIDTGTGISIITDTGTGINTDTGGGVNTDTGTDLSKRVTRFEYDSVGNLVKTIYPDDSYEAFSYDTENRLISRTDELGYVTSFEYDPLGRLIATRDPAGNRWESSYDVVGRKIADKDPVNHVTSYVYDTLDRLISTTRADGTIVKNEFDIFGNLLKSIDATGATWTWQYDALNRQIRAIQPNTASSTTTFDAAGQVVAESDTLGRVKRYTFDLGGRQLTTTDALGAVWRNSYDTSGRLISVKDPLGAVFSMTYDLMDRVIAESDPLGNAASYEFDAAGRRIAKTDALGNRSIIAYDYRDRITSEVDPEGRVVSYGYDSASHRVRLTDGANRIWRWELDLAGRVTSEVDPLGNTTKYSYDGVGNRTTLVNARNQATNYHFDTVNRLVKVDYPSGGIATMAYDPEGRELTRSDINSLVTKKYDSVGNIKSETFQTAACSDSPKTWSYVCDLAGNRVSAIDPEGNTLKYKLDALNRLVSLTPPGNDNEIKYTFDAAGRQITVARPGVNTTNTYDLAGRLLLVKHELNQKSKNVISSRKYTYDAVGNRLSMADDEGGTVVYKYDKSNWLTKVTYPDGQKVSYTYNGAGDRLTETTQSSNSKIKPVTVNLFYDSAGRMTGRASDTFQYDSDGNLIRSTEGDDITDNTWSFDNRLLKVEAEIECPKHHKKHCNICPKKLETIEEYGYLPNDWRRIIRKEAGMTYFSVYDGDDESNEYLVAPKVVGKDWKFGPFCWKPKIPKLFSVREFISSPGSDDIETTNYHGKSLSMLKDALGSTIALTNHCGNIVAKVDYDAWGNFRWPDKKGYGVAPCREDDLDDLLDRLEGKFSLGGCIHDYWHHGKYFAKTMTPYLYTGRRYSTATELYWNRNRCRFSRSDPKIFSRYFTRMLKLL
ncbi:MAG: RHS repeat protein [Candidatus Riflebacteria bacterium]|nr:RHS repeat protein [Candidatus Riflebacteria bacterium]